MAVVNHEVVVVGAIGIDTNVYPYGDEIDWTVEANFTRDLDYVGQAGGYTARGFARLGCRTAFIGAVGDDWQGREIRRVLAGDGIAALLFADPVGTHRSVNFMYRDGRRKNFYDGKGHMEIMPDLGACRAFLAGARLVHLHLENWCRQLLPLARESGAVVSCDLQDVVALDDPYRRDFIEQADVLFFSTTNFPDPQPAVDHLLGGDRRRIVVGGMGKAGALVATSAGTVHVPPPDTGERVVDTNGAGDALAVGFLASHVLHGYGVGDALLRGQIAARHTCALEATSASLIDRPTLDAVQRRLARSP